MRVHVQLRDLIAVVTPERAGDGDYPILSMTMRRGLIDQDEKFKKRVASVDTSQYKRVRRGQLVIGFPIDEGVLAFQNLYDEAIVSPAYYVWEIKPSAPVDQRFLERFLRSPRALAFYRAKLQGTTARRRTLPDDVFLSLEVPLPDIHEQRRFSEILNKAESLGSKREEASRLVDDFLRAVFLTLFGDPATNSKNWAMGSVRDLVASANYGTSKKANEAEGKYPVLRMNNITYSGRMDLASLKYVDLDPSEESKFLARKGDVLFNRTNSKELVGKTAVYEQDDKMAIAGYLVRVRTNEKASPHYLSAFLNSAYGKQMLQSMCKSIVGMANINAQELQNIRIMIPPRSLQDRYADLVERVRRLEGHLASSIKQLESMSLSLSLRFFD